MKYIKMLAATAVTVALAFSSVNVANAAEVTQLEAMTQIVAVDSSLSERKAEDLQRGLTLIMAIPDAVLLQGDEATHNWIQSNVQRAQNGSIRRANFWKCAAAIAALIASTAFPAAKILKIKKLIKALGGVANAVRIIAGASFSYEKLRALGGAAAALAAELTGIGSVRSACFA